MTIRAKSCLGLVSLTLMFTACSGGTNDAVPTTSTIVDKAFGVSLLTQAIPGAMDLPVGWMASVMGDSSVTEQLESKTGLGFGICSGPNRDGLLQQNGVLAWAWSAQLASASGATGYVGIFEFPDSTSATRFMESTAAQYACGAETYEEMELGDDNSESETPDKPRVDKFIGSDNSSIWNVSASYSTGGPLASSTVPGLTLVNNWEYGTRLGGKDYGQKEQQIVAYEQYQNVLLRYSIYGGCCTYGFSNTDAISDDTRPTVVALDELAIHVRAKMLTALGLGTVEAQL